MESWWSSRVLQGQSFTQSCHMAENLPWAFEKGLPFKRLSPQMHIPLLCLEFASFQPINWMGRIHLWLFATEFSIEQILWVSFWVVTCGEGQGTLAPRVHPPPALVFLPSFPGRRIAAERKARGRPIPPEFLSRLLTSDSYNLLSKLPGTSRQTQSLCFPLPLRGESI